MHPGHANVNGQLVGLPLDGIACKSIFSLQNYAPKIIFSWRGRGVGALLVGPTGNVYMSNKNGQNQIVWQHHYGCRDVQLELLINKSTLK